jgi:protein SCO1
MLPLNTPPFWQTRKKLLIAVLSAFLLIVVIGLALFSLRPYEFHGMILQSPTQAGDFQLTGDNGQPVALSDFSGKIVLLYFGYTICPDVCPTTLADLHVARKTLGKRADQVQVLMVTVDPERDTVEVLSQYIPHFDPSFIGLTGSLDQITQIATNYGVYFEKRKVNSALGYLIDHTATVMVIDRKGYVREVFPYGTPAKDIAADLAYLLDH